MKRNLLRAAFFILIINVLSFLSADPVKLQVVQGQTRIISQYGITWYFSEDIQFGQYVNGDYWVLDDGKGVDLIAINPPSTLNGSRIINGSMLNPKPDNGQGFDNSISVLDYKSELNAARPNNNILSAANPLSLRAGDSLVSTISYPDADVRPQVLGCGGADNSCG